MDLLSRFDFPKKIKETQSRLVQKLNKIEAEMDLMRQALGRIESRQILETAKLADSELKENSQTGEDGILQKLVQQVPVKRQIFIEFGVERYTQCNTRFLLEKDYWSGLVLDGSESNIQRLRADSIYWRRNIKAEAVFITKDNINEVFQRNGVTGDIGILSVDIDGNDYWVWDAINTVDPAIVVAEYNALFGPDHAISVPYDPTFYRTTAHYSNLFYGTSLAALEHLAKKKGYRLVYANKFGNNAFFVKNGLAENVFPGLTAKQAYSPQAFGESRSESGKLTFLRQEDALKVISSCTVVDVKTGQQHTIQELFLRGPQ